MIRVFRVYGVDGHRQRESFSPSINFTTSNGNKVWIRNSDLTGTNDYTEVVIQANTNERIIRVLKSQIDDGIFENSRVGKVIEVVGLRRGHWIKSEFPTEKYCCSVCGAGCWYYDYEGDVARSRYCPQCGAKMDEMEVL